jgi:hypothetical protein
MNVFEYILVEPLRDAWRDIKRLRDNVSAMRDDRDLLEGMLDIMKVDRAGATRMLYRMIDRDHRRKYGNERYATMVDAVEFLHEYATSVQSSSLMEDDPRAEEVRAAAKMLLDVAESELKQAKAKAHAKAGQ